MLEGVRLASGAAAPRDAGQVTYVVVEPVPARAAAAEQRGGQRRRTRLRSGKVADRGNRFVVECLFHDRSTLGARLRLVKDVPLPSPLMIYDDETGTIESARVVWRTCQEVGIRFDAQRSEFLGRNPAALGRQFYAL